MDQIRNYLGKVFKEIGFEIEIKASLKTMDFLDVTFNLANKICRKYKKTMTT